MKKAFSLLELLIAVSVTFGLLTLIGVAFSSASGATQSSAWRVDTWREARGALAVMQRDFRTVARIDAVPTLAITASEPGGAHPSEEVRLLTYQPGGAADVASMVGYRCVWDAGAGCYYLERFSFSGEEAIDAITGAADTPGMAREEVARYVWDLTFRPVEAGGAPMANAPTAAYHRDLPAWVEIRFKAVGEKAVERLKTMPVTQATWTTPSDPVYRQVIAPHQYQIVTRVRLASASKLP